MGYIYRLFDRINGMSYIGQTSNNDPMKRIRDHFRIIKSDYVVSSYKVYNYLRSIPFENIGYEILLECDNKVLNDKEVEYIDKFDAFRNGLNSTRGGTGERYSLMKEHLDSIIHDFISGVSLVDISNKYGISTSYISKWLTLLGVHRSIDVKSYKTNKRIPLVMYDIYFNRLKEFKSYREAIEFLEMTFSGLRSNMYTRITQSCNIGSIAYGYRWQRKGDLILGDKEFNTKFDREKYNGYNGIIDECGIIHVLDSIPDKLKIKDKSEEKRCINCGCRLVSNNITGLCRECLISTGKHSSYNDRQVPSTVKVIYPFDPNQLAELYPKYTANSIAKAAGVSYTTVNKWLHRYELK